MVTSYQYSYLKRVAPEITIAIDAEYTSNTPFINTRRICDKILETPEKYPLLSCKPPKHIMDAITKVCDDILCYRRFSSKVHRNGGGRVYVRDVCAEKA